MTLWNICQKAASKLDEIKPNWFEDIDLDEINLRRCDKCLYHNIFNVKAYPAGIKLEQLNPKAFGYPGKNLPPLSDGRAMEKIHKEYDKYYAKLKQYWNTLINQRKE